MALARAFAPVLVVAPQGCNWDTSVAPARLGGEYVFVVQALAPDRVRIAYLPAYYRDCGWRGIKCLLPFVDCAPHDGDSEAIAMTKHVLFIQGAGQGAYEQDALLVASLRSALGPAYDVRYPRMANEASPDYHAWKAQIALELARLEGEIVLVGHSLGGSVLLKYLAEEFVGKPIAAVILLAAPYWGADDDWDWEDVRLPEDVAARLASVPAIVFYHSRDDEIVPFHHLARYAAKIPQAVVRELDGRGHQFGNDLADVAAEIAPI